MKPLHLSKFSIFIIAILIVAFVSFGMVVYSSPSSSISNQNERIYLHTPSSNSDFNGYVKIEDMKPNSARVLPNLY